MKELITNSAFFGVTISLLTYMLGLWLKKKFKFGFLNPLLIVVTLIVVAACHMDYNTYYEGAKYLSYLLTPATVCLAIPLYEQLAQLKRHWKAIAAGILSGVLTSLCCVLAMVLLFRLSHETYVTLLPKSITPVYWATCWASWCSRCSASMSRWLAAWRWAPPPMPLVPAKPWNWARWRAL